MTDDEIERRLKALENEIFLLGFQCMALRNVCGELIAEFAMTAGPKADEALIRLTGRLTGQAAAVARLVPDPNAGDVEVTRVMTAIQAAAETALRRRRSPRRAGE